MGELLRLYLCFLPIVSLSFCLERFENVAVNKACNISSIYFPGDSCTFAVNGQTTGEYSETGKRDCIHTNTSDTNSWWEVDLGRPYPVYSISVYPRRKQIVRMQNCVITVDGKHCYTFTTVQVDNSGKIDINCTSGVVNGRVIRVSRPGNSPESRLINICEFQVWSCPLDFWGSQCDRACGHCIDGSVCDKVTGHCLCKPGFLPPLCTQECDSGTYGEACTKRCGSGCKNSFCNSTSGYCECLSGWKPPLCNLNCDSGTYGESCIKTCGSGCKNSVCNSISGYCECLPGWKPPLCHLENVAVKKTCNISSTLYVAGDSCTFAVNGQTTGEYSETGRRDCIHTGLSDTNTWWEVDLGRPYPVYSISVYPRRAYYGRMQNSVITVDGQHCYTFTTVQVDTSGKIDINCTSGVVNGRVIRVSRPGNSVESSFLNICEFQVWSCTLHFWGSQCDRECGDCTDGAVCDKVTGHCPCKPGFKPPLCIQECDSGTYGEACSKTCGSGCKNSDCNTTSGHCECLPGWKPPPLCHLGCDSGTYGEACMKTCGSGCKNSNCNTTSGHCECLPGWMPPLCHQGCPLHFWGSQCDRPCGQCIDGAVCDKATGHCICKPGFLPPLCTQENVALRKRCNVKSMSPNDNSCDKGVNGDTLSSELGCFESARMKGPWWEVDLGRPYPVYNITVWPREYNEHRLKGCVITVDGQHCYTFTSVPDFSSSGINISCTSGIINGRVVRVSSSQKTLYEKVAVINFCEIQVWSCAAQFWGSQCENACKNCTEGAICDKVTGLCP